MTGTIDEVIVKVTGSVDKDGSQKINELATSLSNLKTSIKGGYNNLDKLSESLDKLKTSAEGLDTLTKSLQSLQGIGDALKPLTSLESPRGLTKTVKNLEQLPNVIAKITPDTLENVARVSTQLADALTPLANKFSQIGVGFQALQQLADKYGVSVTKLREYHKSTKSVMNGFMRTLKNVGSEFIKITSLGGLFFKSNKNGFDKTISKVKQLGLSLLGTRSIFTATRKAISEYMQMDQELTKQTTNLWKALGAQLAPAVEEVLYLFKQFVRVIYSFVYAITGVDLIARANAKAMKAWGKSAKDTLGNLQKFDDLNVANFGTGTGDNQLIELDKIDLSPIQWIIDATIRIKKAFKEAFNTGQWKGVGKELANLLNEITTRLQPEKILGGFEKVGKSISDLFNGWIEELNGAKLGKALETLLLTFPRLFNTMLTNIEWDIIGEKVTDALKNIDFKEIITSWAKIFTNIVDGLQTAFLNMDTDTLSNTFTQIAMGIVTSINTLITTIQWGEIAVKLHDVIVGMDWSSIFNTIGSILLNILAGIGESVAGLLFGVKFTDKTSAIFTGIGITIGYILLKVFKSTITTGLLSIVKKVFNVPGLKDIKGSTKGLSESSFTVPKVTTILKGLADLALIIAGVEGVILAIGELQRIPGFEKYTKQGLSLLVDVFQGLGSIILPLVTISAGIAVLGTISLKTVSLGFVGFAEIIAGIPAVITGIGALVEKFDLAKYTKAGLAVVVDVFEALGEIIVPIGEISALVVALGFATPILVTSGLVGLTEIIEHLIKVMVKLGEIFENPVISKLMEKGGEILISFATTIGKFGGAIVAGFMEQSFTALPSMGQSLTDFMTNAQGFFDGLTNLPEYAMEAIKTLAEAILILTAADLLKAIKDWIGGGGKSALSTFGDDLKAFGPKLTDYVNSVSTVDNAKLNASTNAAKTLSEFAKNLPEHGGLKQWFTGDNRLSVFGDELALFGSDLASYYTFISTIGEKGFDLIDRSTLTVQQLSTMASNLPDVVEQSKVRGQVYSVKLISEFGTQLAILGEKLKDYWDDISEIDVVKMDNITAAVDNLSNTFKRIKDNKVDGTVTSFGKALKDSAGDIKTFFNTSLSGSAGWSSGYTFGKSVGNGISQGLKDASYPSINILTSAGLKLGSFKIQAYEKGTNQVPYEGLYHLHKDEAVVPKKYNPAVGGGYTGELDEKIDRLISIVENMDTTTTVNVGNKTLYEEQRRYNNFQRNKYGSINV